MINPSHGAKLITQADQQLSEADDTARVCGVPDEWVPRQPSLQTAYLRALAQRYRYTMHGSL